MPRPRPLTAALIVLVAFAALGTWTCRSGDRRPASPQTATAAVPAIAARSVARPPVILIGLDGADWSLLDQYVARGAMPNLATLVREGTSGYLRTLSTPLSPLIWNSMVTGVGPLEHRVLDFLRVNPTTGRREPITSDERKVPAIWNMATQAGKRTATFGFWATWPAESVNGLLVSDRLFTFLYRESEPPPGVVFPQEREDEARTALRAVEQAVTLDELRAYLPGLGDDEYRRAVATADPYAHPVSALRRILIETRVYDRLALESFERDRPDLLLVYFQGTDTIGHVFAPFAPPRQASVSAAEFDRYSRVPETYFREIDRLLGGYVAAAKKVGAVVCLVSDHGFKWSDGRPTTMSSFANTTAAKWHNDLGMYLLWGPSIPRSSDRREGEVSQVAATLLALTGLPRGAGLASPALPGATDNAGDPVDYRASFTPLVSEAMIADGGKGADEDTLAKLRALGYISASGGGGERKGTRTAGSFNNEGLLLRNDKRTDEAIQAFDAALAVDPSLASAAWNLSDLLFTRPASLDRSDSLLVRAYANGLPDGLKFLIGRAIGYQRGGTPDRSLKLLDDALSAKTDDAEVWLFRGRYRIESQNCEGARSDFAQAIRRVPDNPAAHASAGMAALCLGDTAAARVSFERSLKLDPNQPQVRSYLRGVSR